MDIQIFQFINQFAGRWPAADHLAIFWAQYSGYAALSILIALAAFNKGRWFRVSLWALGAAFVSRFVATELIRFFYDRPRPFEALDVTQLLSHSPEASLPSGHAAFYFALAWFLFFVNKKLGAIFLIAALLMGLSRIFVGIHYPGDIAAGFGVGLVSAALVYYLHKKWYSRG